MGHISKDDVRQMTMRKIEEATELMAASARQGLELSSIEASIIIGYMDGHDYELLLDEELRVYLHDGQDGENHDDDALYSIRECVEFCQEMNEELLLDAQSSEKVDGEYILDLRKDEIIIGSLMERVAKVVPPKMREYNVVIVETLKKTVRVEAASWAEAQMVVSDAWKNGDYILDADSFAGVMFTLGS